MALVFAVPRAIDCLVVARVERLPGVVIATLGPNDLVWRIVVTLALRLGMGLHGCLDSSHSLPIPTVHLCSVYLLLDVVHIFLAHLAPLILLVRRERLLTDHPQLLALQVIHVPRVHLSLIVLCVLF